MCLGHAGAALVEVKDIPKLRVRFQGTPNRTLWVGALSERETQTVEVELHVTRISTLGSEERCCCNTRLAA
eukprot:5469094-Amphidinium_carterae.1